jgi:HD superfamily phosphodiesterase
MCAIVAKKIGLSKEDARDLMIAAILHDYGRIGNCNNTKHGYDGVEMLKSQGITFNVTIGDLIINHCRADSKILNKTVLHDILKDCDALDRVRTGDLDMNYLRTDLGKNMVDIAKELYDITKR